MCVSVGSSANSSVYFSHSSSAASADCAPFLTSSDTTAVSVVMPCVALLLLNRAIWPVLALLLFCLAAALCTSCSAVSLLPRLVVGCCCSRCCPDFVCWRRRCCCPGLVLPHSASIAAVPAAAAFSATDHAGAAGDVAAAVVQHSQAPAPSCATPSLARCCCCWCGRVLMFISPALAAAVLHGQLQRWLLTCTLLLPTQLLPGTCCPSRCRTDPACCWPTHVARPCTCCPAHVKSEMQLLLQQTAAASAWPPAPQGASCNHSALLPC